MNATAKNVATAATAAKARKARKPPTARRTGAEAALAAAKSDQERTVARAHLKIVRFEELATPRVRRALKALDSVANLANRGAYTYNDEQANKLLNALTNRMTSVINKFKGEKDKKDEFTI